MFLVLHSYEIIGLLLPISQSAPRHNMRNGAPLTLPKIKAWEELMANPNLSFQTKLCICSRFDDLIADAPAFEISEKEKLDWAKERIQRTLDMYDEQAL